MEIVLKEIKMKNALEELEPFLKGMTLVKAKLSCERNGKASVDIETSDMDKLKEWAKDVNYDNDFGERELFGTVYLRDSENNPVWLTRGEYDGSEWWDVNRIPDIYLKP